MATGCEGGAGFQEAIAADATGLVTEMAEWVELIAVGVIAADGHQAVCPPV